MADDVERFEFTNVTPNQAFAQAREMGVEAAVERKENRGVERGKFAPADHRLVMVEVKGLFAEYRLARPCCPLGCSAF